MTNRETKMAYRTDPGMRMVNFWLPSADADALVKVANSAGLSRSELLRRAARELIEHETENEVE
jgi:hypothetical protein